MAGFRPATSAGSTRTATSSSSIARTKHPTVYPDSIDAKADRRVVPGTNFRSTIVSPRTMPDRHAAPTMTCGGGSKAAATGTVGDEPAPRMKEFLMANTDLSTQFEKISDKAQTASQHLR